jgi:phospholipase C
MRDDSALSRREFLERSAYSAGLAGIGGLPAATILAEEAEAANKLNRMPSPRNVPIDHFVILMMENRSFDHYFGWLTGQADGIQIFTAPDSLKRAIRADRRARRRNARDRYIAC